MLEHANSKHRNYTADIDNFEETLKKNAYLALITEIDLRAFFAFQKCQRTFRSA